MSTAFVNVAPSTRFASRLLDAGGCDSIMAPVRTCKTDIPHNFGPVTNRNEQVFFTCERPGNPPKDTKGGTVSKDKLDEWVAFMKGKEIKHVFALLDAHELEIYAEQGGLMELYKSAGMIPHFTPMGPEGACSEIMSALYQVEQRNEKAVVHCTGGTGRAGRVAAAWLVTRYDLTPEEATKEVIAQAIESGVRRLGDVEKLTAWMSK